MTSNPYVSAGATDPWTTEALAAGRQGTQQLLWVRSIDPAPAVRAALALGPDEPAVSRARLMLLDDIPVEIAESSYPASIAAGTPLASPARIRGGAVTALATLGHAAAVVEEQVTARLPDAYEIETLGIDPGEPMLVLTRISYDAAGRRVEYAVNRMVAARSAPIGYRLRASS